MDKNQHQDVELKRRYFFASDDKSIDIPTYILDSQNGELLTYKEVLDFLNTRPEPEEASQEGDIYKRILRELPDMTQFQKECLKKALDNIGDDYSEEGGLELDVEIIRELDKAQERIKELETLYKTLSSATKKPYKELVKELASETWAKESLVRDYANLHNMYEDLQKELAELKGK